MHVLNEWSSLTFDEYQELSPGKFPPIKLPPDESPPENPPYPPENPHLQYSYPCFLIFSTGIFTFFVFSLLSPLWLVLLERLFRNSVLKVLKSEIQKSIYLTELQFAGQTVTYSKECWSSSMIIGHHYNPPVCFECFCLWSFLWRIQEYDVTQFNQLNLKVHWCRFENLPLCSCSYKDTILKISHS